mmetsp:Transcript_37811/g.111942  ORF Transcript_37811/g.111942 Transcript_37811/m.111942 type:complete len:212 (-) Transcript_37811:389-1024(-)
MESSHAKLGPNGLGVLHSLWRANEWFTVGSYDASDASDASYPACLVVTAGPECLQLVISSCMPDANLNLEHVEARAWYVLLVECTVLLIFAIEGIFCCFSTWLRSSVLHRVGAWTPSPLLRASIIIKWFTLRVLKVGETPQRPSRVQLSKLAIPVSPSLASTCVGRAQAWLWFCLPGLGTRSLSPLLPICCCYYGWKLRNPLPSSFERTFS